MINHKKTTQRRKNIIKIGLLLILFTGAGSYYLLENQKSLPSEIDDIVQTVTKQTANPKVDESKISKKQTREHIVPAQNPRYLSLPRLGIDKARILSVGKKPNNEIDTPAGIFDVGWFNQSAKPGQTSIKPIFLDGHNGGPNVNGIFKKLPNIGIGEIVTIERGDGKIFNYKITENYVVYLDKFSRNDMTKLMTADPKKETLVMVTCTGKWIAARQTYDRRNLVRALLID